MQYSPTRSVVSRRDNLFLITFFFNVTTPRICVYKIILQRLKKYFYKNLFLQKRRRRGGRRSDSLIVVLIYHLSTRRVRCWRSPPESSSPSLRVSARRGAIGVRVPIQAMFAVGFDIHSLAVRYHGSKLRGRPFMRTRIYLELMYIIYNAGL